MEMSTVLLELKKKETWQEQVLGSGVEPGWIALKDGACEQMELQGRRTARTVHLDLIQVERMSCSLHINLI